MDFPFMHGPLAVSFALGKDGALDCNIFTFSLLFFFFFFG